MPLDEKTREEKEAYASKIMAEMKLKNEKLKERYKEVQRDRERAEERNSSITLNRNLRKEADKDFTPRTKPEREWDRGKPNVDSEDWDSKHLEREREYYSHKNSRVYSDRRDRRDDNWRSRPNASSSSSRPTSSFFSKYHHSNKNETVQESSVYRNDGNHFNNRPRSHYNSRNANDSHSHPNHNSKGEDYSHKVSSTQMNSDFKKENASHRAEGDELMWQSGSMIEAQIKFNRIENWVKSINTNQGLPESTDPKNIKEEHKSHGRGSDFGLREKPKKFGTNDVTPKNFKEQDYFRKSRECDGKSVEPVSTRKKRSSERVSSALDSKNFQEVKRKNATDRPRRKCESDASDHASSMKESDDTIGHCGSKSNNFHQQDKKVDQNLQDPWGSDIPNNENAKDFIYSEGDEAWQDWGTDQQPKDIKQSSQLKNKNEYGTKPLQYNSKAKHTRQYEKSSWTESKYQPARVSRNNADFNKRTTHKPKSGDDRKFHSAHSQVSVSSSAKPVEENLNGIWDPVDKSDNQEEFNEEWGSEVEKNTKITSLPELGNNEVLVNQSLDTAASSFDNKEDGGGWGSFEIKNNQEEVRKIIEPVKEPDSSKHQNNNGLLKIEESSNDVSPAKEQYLNSSMESNEQSEESKCNSTQAEVEEFSKPMIEECDIINVKEVSESVQSDSEFQKMDYCNESSDSNSQAVNHEGSSVSPPLSVGKDSCIEKNIDQLDLENFNEKISNEEVVSLKETPFPHEEKCNNELKKVNWVSSDESNISGDNVIHSKIDVESPKSTTVSSSHQEDVPQELESERLDDIHCKNVIHVSNEKPIDESHGEPDVGVSNSDEDSWSTVSEEDDEKIDSPLAS